jgi:regulatory protein
MANEEGRPVRITRLRPVGRRTGYVAVEADGSRLGVLPVEEIGVLGLEVGIEVEGEVEGALVTALERAKAYDAAVRLLAVRGRSVQEIVGRLRRKGLRPDAVDHAVGRLEGEGLLDDAAMAREFARSRAERGYGRSRILAELSRRRVDRHTAEGAVADVGEDDEGERRQRMLVLARKRCAQLRGLEREVAKRRLVGYLARRGYGGSEVWRVADEALGEAGNHETGS